MDKHMETIRGFSYDDFLSVKPYEYLYRFKGTSFEREQIITALKKRAADVGYKNFTKSNKCFVESKKSAEKAAVTQNKTEFPDQPLELNCGQWTADAEGVRRPNSSGVYEYACRHPIMLVARLEDHDSKTTQFVVGYRMPGEAAEWQELVFDNLDLSTTNGIIKLSAWGIDVTSNSASKLMAYLNELRMLNYDRIPKQSSIKRMGYIDGVGFAPYSDKLVFGAAAEFRALYDSISAKGSYEAWLDIAKKCREESVPAHIMLSASFASPLLAVVGSLPFFVHLWSPDGGTGKTVALKLAASIWANPEMGKYVQTLNATNVGMEKTAAFLGQLPYCMDELQLSRDQQGKSKIDVYQLAEGVGRTRGTKGGGVEATSRWQCCFLTTGESPITDIKRGSGAVNRVIDIGCSTDKPVLKDGRTVTQVIDANYGHAGRIFISKLYEYDNMLESVKITYNEYRRQLEKANVTGKQAMAAAAILTASQLAAYWIFKDEKNLTVEEIVDYLATNETASLGANAYEYLRGWIAQYSYRFVCGEYKPSGDFYGAIEGNTVKILRHVFDEAMSKAGYNPRSVLRYFRDERILDLRDDCKGFDKSISVNGHKNSYVVIKLIHFGKIEGPPDPDCPF